MFFNTDEYSNFVLYLQRVGYSELPLSNNPYEVYRCVKKGMDGSKDTVVLYKKANGLISFSKKDVSLVEDFNRAASSMYASMSARRNTLEELNRKEKEEVPDYELWQQAEEIARKVNSCSFRKDKENILAGVASVKVLRRVAVILSEIF